MKRKDKKFSERLDALELLKEILEEKNIGKGELKVLIYKYRQYELIKMFKTTEYQFKRLRNEWEIFLPPQGYWHPLKSKKN